jgi:superfamily II DNA/RNA helicase
VETTGSPGRPAVDEDEKVKTISIRTNAVQGSAAADTDTPESAADAAPTGAPTATEAAAAPPSTFADLGVLPETVDALNALGITHPFPIQTSTIPVALAGSDVIGQAKTGTGKTLAFGIPLLQRVAGPGSDPDPDVAEIPAQAAQSAAPAKSGARRRRGRSGSGSAGGLAPANGTPQALVVVPTRELAVQVTNDLLAAGKVRAIRVHALYGGRAYEPQVAALRAGIDIAVGTPGRLLDLSRQGHLSLNRVRTLVLDEADEMLDLGFLPDVERIIGQLPAQRQTMLFSATMPGQVISLARQYMTKPTHIRAADPHDAGTTVRAITQFVYRAHSLDKVEMLTRILQAEGRGLTMIFARTKRTVAKIAEELEDRHFAVAAVHGDLGQGAREQALRAFRNGKIDVLVATDVAARGIDVEGVTHVINFQCPEDEKVYTHRIGRTGRAGATGIAITLVDWDEVPRWQLINKALALPFPEPPETYSTSPQLYADLGIREGIKGVLPRQERVRQGLDAEVLEDLGETGRGRQPKSGARRGAKDAPAAPKAERPARTPRQRTRTRGGTKVAGEAEGTVSLPVESNAPVTDEAPVSVAATADAAVEAAPRRRARTRKTTAPKTAVPKTTAPTARPSRSVKLESGALADPSVATVPAPANSLEQSAGDGEPSGTDAEKAPARKRTRTRKAAAAPNPAEDVQQQAPTGDGDEGLDTGPVANPRRTQLRPPRNRTRSRKNAAAQPSAPSDASDEKPAG